MAHRISRPRASDAIRMLYKFGADGVALIHLGFILFVVLGGLLVLRWKRLAWLHLPAAVWGVLIEFAGFYCPLTRLENWLLRRAGHAGYPEGFIAHHIFALIYPGGLTRPTELVLGALVLLVNLYVYMRVCR
ncbi:MAG: hypothetical protein JWN02_803 [Acidobacteria bacterium]|nr:hypothetical protein [Acidobacteriota bacterium]